MFSLFSLFFWHVLSIFSNLFDEINEQKTVPALQSEKNEEKTVSEKPEKCGPEKTKKTEKSITIIQVRPSGFPLRCRPSKGLIGNATTFCAEFRWAQRWVISKLIIMNFEIAQRSSAQNVVAFRINPFKGLVFQKFEPVCLACPASPVYREGCEHHQKSYTTETSLRLTGPSAYQGRRLGWSSGEQDHD